MRTECPSALQLNVASLEKLEKVELRAWLAERLQNRDFGLATDQRSEPMPDHLLSLMWPKLQSHTQSSIRDVLVDFLRDLSREPDSKWNGLPGHWLMLFIQTVKGAEFYDVLRELSDGRFFNPSLDEVAFDLHYRILQTLVSCEWKGDPGFWYTQYQRVPIRYLGVTLNGLALINIDYAMNLIAQLRDAHWGVNRVRTFLNGAFRKYSSKYVQDSIQRYFRSADPAMRQLLRSVCRSHGVIIYDYQMISQVLDEFGYHHNADDPIQAAA